MTAPGPIQIPNVIPGHIEDGDVDLGGGPSQAPDVDLGRSPTLESEIALLFPWLPAPLVAIYVEEYINSGDPDLAWAKVRASSEYDTFLPGMRREDGTFRLEGEQAYFALMDAYADVFRSYNLNPGFFENKFVSLLVGDVSPEELDIDRIGPVYERVLESSAAIMEDYARRYDLELTPEAIIAAIIDPELGDRIINRQITISEIAGEGAESGFGVSDALVESLYRAGVDRREADRLFSQAENVIPVLSTMAKRHADPDDTFDLKEFVSADIFSDPKQRRRMRRLVAQERSLFANVGAQTSFARQNRGGISGLRSL